MDNLTQWQSTSSNPIHVYLSSLVSARSRHAMMSGLRSSMAIIMGRQPEEISDDQVYCFPWHQMEYQHLQAIRTKLIEADYKPATINTYLSAIRGVLTEAWKLQLIGAERHHVLVEINNVEETREPAGRYISPDEIKAAVYVCLSDPNRIQGIRDAAILTFLYGVGARREEATTITTKSFAKDLSTVKIMGKGRKERTPPIPGFVRRYLRGWIEIAHPDNAYLPFFLAVRKNGSLGNAQLSTTTIWNVVVERFNQASLEPVAPHSFRRSMATNYLDQGENEGTVAGIGGWSSPVLVQRYNRHREKQMRNAADRLDLDI